MDQLLSFVLPVRIDNTDRWNNLVVSLKYLSDTFKKAEILLVEDAASSQCSALCQSPNIRYHFIINEGNFSRAAVLNQGLLLSSRKYIVVYDLDVMVRPGQIFGALRVMEKGNVHIVLPHNSIFVNVKGELKEELVKLLDPELIRSYRCLLLNRKEKNIDLYPIPSGVVIFRKDLLLKIGGFNKKMKSYGWEDIEVLKRAAKLGIFYFSFYDGNVVHLDHARGGDSKPNEHYQNNKREFQHVNSMKPVELIQYINTDLSITDEPAFTMADYIQIRKQNRMGLLFFRFIINRAFLKVLNKKW